MKKLILITLLVATSLLTTNVFAARVFCEAAKFERIYQDGEAVFVQVQGLPWHVLGFEGDSDLNKKIERLRKAERKGWHVQLVFPNGYDENCKMMDSTVAVKKVKLIKSDGEEMDAEDGE